MVKESRKRRDERRRKRGKGRPKVDRSKVDGRVESPPLPQLSTPTPPIHRIRNRRFTFSGSVFSLFSLTLWKRCLSIISQTHPFFEDLFSSVYKPFTRSSDSSEMDDYYEFSRLAHQSLHFGPILCSCISFALRQLQDVPSSEILNVECGLAMMLCYGRRVPENDTIADLSSEFLDLIRKSMDPKASNDLCVQMVREANQIYFRYCIDKRGKFLAPPYSVLLYFHLSRNCFDAEASRNVALNLSHEWPLIDSLFQSIPKNSKNVCDSIVRLAKPFTPPRFNRFVNQNPDAYTVWNRRKYGHHNVSLTDRPVPYFEYRIFSRFFGLKSDD